MTIKPSKAQLIIGAMCILAIGLGAAAAAIHQDIRAGIQGHIRSAETTIRADLALIKTAPSRATADDAPPDNRIIQEARIQLALAALQEVVRSAVEDHGGEIASMSGAEPTEQPWGATIRLSARFEAPHASVIDIFAALESGEPFVRAEEVTLSSRSLPGGGDADVTVVSAEAEFSAFTSAKPTDR